MAPRLESWNAATHPDQVRLRVYLLRAAAVLEDRLRGEDRLTLDLAVGLPRRALLTSGGHNLDNYLRPLIRHLGPPRFDAVFATKHHSSGSAITVADAELAPGELGPPQLAVRTTASAETLAWKQQIFSQCQSVALGPPNSRPLALTVCFAVSPRRNWTNLWKPAIDSLGPVLGMTNAHRPFQPNDDRIVDLALHRTIHDGLDNDVLLSFWWRPAA